MRKRKLMLPFAVMALGVILFLVQSPKQGKTTHTNTAAQAAQPVQSVEQQKAAEIYFRIMSWLSIIAPKDQGRAEARPAASVTNGVRKDPSANTSTTNVAYCNPRSDKSDDHTDNFTSVR